MQQAQIKVRKAARALAKAGILVACSMRIEKRHFPLCAANPMGMILFGGIGASQVC